MKPVLRSRIAIRAVAVALVVALVVAATWMLRTYEPTASSWYPKCVFYQTTGLHCPGCGATRAFRALVSGDVMLAIRCNPLLIVGLPIILCVVAMQRQRERAGGPASPRLAWVLFVVLLAYMIGRNVPSPTRSPLAPPATPDVAPTPGGDSGI